MALRRTRISPNPDFPAKGSGFLRRRIAGGFLPFCLRRKNFFWIILLITLITVPLTVAGCWDAMDIERRAFISAVGLDLVSRPEDSQGEERFIIPGAFFYAITVQEVIPAQLAGGQDGGGGSGQAFWNLQTVTAGSLTEAMEHLASRSGRALDLHHLQVIIVGEALARSNVIRPLDFFLRDPTVRRSVPVVVARGGADEVLAVVPPSARVSGSYVAQLLQAEAASSRAAPPVSLGKIDRARHEGSPIILPRITAGEQDVKMAGAGVVVAGKLQGWLGEAETVGLRWATGQIKGSRVVVDCPWEPGEGRVEVVEITGAKRWLVTKAEGAFLDLKIVIEGEGFFGEHQDEHDANDPLYLDAVSEAANQRVKEITGQAIWKLQQFHADAIGFGQELERYQPSIWKKVKPTWPAVFASTPVTVEVDISIRRIGSTR